MKPVLFLDVDGVLNLIPHDQTQRPECDWDDIELHHVMSGTLSSTPAAARGPFPMWMSKQMAVTLFELPVEIRWLTTWADEANSVLSPLLGLPGTFPVTARPNYTTSFNWKLNAVQDYVADGEARPFIWIDDDAIDSFARRWVENCGVHSLPLLTDETKGITRVMIDAVREFTEKHNA